MVDLLKAFDTGDTVDSAQLAKVDAEAIEQAKDFMFPGLTDSAAAEIETFVKQALVEPIPGLVWVPKPLLMRTGMFDAPLINGLHDNPAVSGFVYGLDTMNNIMNFGGDVLFLRAE